jgi:hypothetical protein
VNDKPELGTKAARKLRRRVENEGLATQAGFWNTPRSADQKGYTRPVDRQAAKELSHVVHRKPTIRPNAPNKKGKVFE